MRENQSCFEKTVLVIILSLGFVVFSFCSLNWYRMFWLISFGFVFLIRHKIFYSSIVRTMNRNVGILMCVIVIIGVSGRLLLLCSLDGFSTIEGWLREDSDNLFFWQKSMEIARGYWPDSKSWTTVVVNGFLISIFGLTPYPSAMVGVGMHFCTGLLLYNIGRKIISPLVGCVCFAIFFCNPSFYYISMQVFSENCYYLALGLFFFFLLKITYGKNAVHCVFAAISAWLATWSRAEGFVIVLTMVCFLLFDFIWGSQTFVERSRRCLIGFSSLVAGCLFTLCVNVSVGTGWSVFPSNDNIWPRLNGANVMTSGMCPQVSAALAEKQRFVEEYLSDFPDDPAGVRKQMEKRQVCPKELVPYVKREIERRWQSMTCGEVLRFIFKKSLIAWGRNWIQCEASFTVKGLVIGLLFSFSHALVLFFSAISIILISKNVLEKGNVYFYFPLVVLEAYGVVLALSEVSPRYPLVFFVLATIFSMKGAAACLGEGGSMDEIPA